MILWFLLYFIIRHDIDNVSGSEYSSCLTQIFAYGPPSNNSMQMTTLNVNIHSKKPGLLK